MFFFFVNIDISRLFFIFEFLADIFLICTWFLCCCCNPFHNTSRFYTVTLKYFYCCFIIRFNLDRMLEEIFMLIDARAFTALHSFDNIRFICVRVASRSWAIQVIEKPMTTYFTLRFDRRQLLLFYWLIWRRILSEALRISPQVLLISVSKCSSTQLVH